MTKRKPKPPRPPSWLCAEAKREWQRVVRSFREQGRDLVEADRGPLACYCESWATYVQATREARNKPVVQGSHGPRKNPACQVANEARIAVLQFARDFGLTPAARSRMKIETGDQVDPVDAYVAERPDVAERERKRPRLRFTGA